MSEPRPAWSVVVLSNPRAALSGAGFEVVGSSRGFTITDAPLWLDPGAQTPPGWRRVTITDDGGIVPDEAGVWVMRT